MPPYPGTNPVTSMDFAKLYREHQVFRSAQSKIQTSQENRLFLLRHADTVEWLSDQQEGLRSNNWLLTGKKTVSGKPLLANNPHWGLSAPSTWYFAHLEPPSFSLNIIGATLPSISAIVLGRTDKIAWGFTNTNPDVQDLYLEKIDPSNPNQYIGPDGPIPFLAREEIIQIKDKTPLRFVVKHSRHGPIISDSHARAKKNN